MNVKENGHSVMDIVLTLTAPPRSGGGCVSKYSVACSMVLVFSRASMACSLEKPISIN